MLAIKECLIREGVLNLDSPMHGSSSHRSHFQLQSSKSSGNMDMPCYRKTFAASSDLSTASATAKTSCQQQEHQQQREEQQQLQKLQPLDASIGSPSRGSYRGQHPHFHHHTTPAYYTDLQLRIHTPNASDVGALNENYQSVYSTPSTQLVEQRCFPKSSTATVAPPPIAGNAQTHQRESFFRLGDSASTDNNYSSTRRHRTSKERCAKSLPPSVNPTKGDGSTEPATQRIQAKSPQNLIACSSSLRSPVAQASQVAFSVAGTAGNVVDSSSGRNSRHTQRFQRRSKRAVRVRSESRPISALYDIICKEKGLDLGDSTTSSSNSSSNEEEPQQNTQSKVQLQTQQPLKQLGKNDTLATFWPLHHHYHRPSMSSVNSVNNQQSELLDRRQQLTKQKRIQPTADAGFTDNDNDDLPYALHSSHKITDLTLCKANSLPPTEPMSSYLKQAPPQPVAIPGELSAPLLNEPPLPFTMGSNEGQPISTNHFFVEPPKMSLPELNRRVNSKKQLDTEDKKQELNTPVYKQGELFETLARWQEELSSTFEKSAQLLNGANGHHHYPYQREHHHHDLSQSPVLDHLHTVSVEDHHQTQTPSQSLTNHDHQHRQATKARRFITRTPRSGSRQSAGHSSPLPPAGYHSDSSYSSPSPTRKHYPATTTTTTATTRTTKITTAASTAAEEAVIATGTDPQSSANGNRSAYETAATTVMTHAKPAAEQLHPQHTEVPKSKSPPSQTNAASAITRPAAVNSDRKKEEDYQQQQQQVRPRYTSPSSLRTSSTPPTRRLSNSELSPKCSNSGFNSEPSGSVSLHTVRSASQPGKPAEPIERRPLVATVNNVSIKQNLSELHFTGGIRPRSSTLCSEAENEFGSGSTDKPRDNLTNLQLSPVQKHKRTPDASPQPRRGADRDKSAKRKSNLNRSYNEEATKDSDEAASTRRRRRRELGMARPLMPGNDEPLRQLLQSPKKSSCSESTSKSESLRQARCISQKLNERTKTELSEIKKIAEQAHVASNERQRRKSTDELTAASTSTQNSPPAPNQIVSILKKKEHAFGECNSSASSNASPVTFSSTVLDTPLASSRSKRQGILKKRSSLDESRYYSRSHSPDERSILIKSARRNSLEEAGSALSPGQTHGILKQSSYESTKSDGCQTGIDCQPHSILKKKDSLSTPSDGGAHIFKHVSISQAVTLAAAELAAHDGTAGIEDGEEHEIRPILKQESTSSEEAVRPPKPILKKKSFGEADEHEIRPILKSSRKSSREEFDLSELTQDANGTAANEASAMRPILKIDSPSKRRSLGSTQQPIGGTSSSSLLKRRTRSLERQDAPPVIDLAAALDAITNSQTVTTPITPVDSLTTSSNISVAERIKHMEMLSTSTTQSSGSSGINGSWESPLQHDSEAATRLLKPSVLRRDIYKDRYNTQPITSEEKSFFKANSTPFDISAKSAFKPSKPLDIRIGAQLQQQEQQPLISPITGQPLSHVPAPLLLSSSTHSAAASSYRLSRSSTQPLQSPRVVHLAAQGAGTPPSSISTNASHSLVRQHSPSDSASLSEQLRLSVGNDSEHIFEMSGLDNDSAIQSLGDDASTTTHSTGVGVARNNSVRARANMFQQLQEQSRIHREAAGREQLPTQSRSFTNSQGTSLHSPPPSLTVDTVASHKSSFTDETNSPNATQDAADADFEPSSLSLAERLAFFSSLCESAACGSGGSTVAAGGARLSSHGSSCASRSPPYTYMERSTSVTPTPMEFSPITNDLKMLPDGEQEQEHELSSAQEHNDTHHLSRSATAPTAVTITTPLLDTTASTPRLLRLRTVGKLVLPDTFLSDNSHRNSCLARMQTLKDIHISMGVRTIGKIKSPFIEQQQQQKMKQSTPIDHCQSKSAKLDLKYMPHSHSNGASDSGDDAHGSDSGKENCAANQQKQQQQQQLQQQQESQTQQMPDMRRKLTQLAQITVQQKTSQGVNRRHTTELSGTAARLVGLSSIRPFNRSHVDKRFAKYFGLDESCNKTTVLKARSTPAKTQTQEALNEHLSLPSPVQNNSSFGVGISVVQRRRDLLKRTRAMSLETTASDGCISPTSMPSPKRAHSPANPFRTCKIASFEDIVITANELHAAGQEFKRLCGEILGT